MERPLVKEWLLRIGVILALITAYHCFTGLHYFLHSSLTYLRYRNFVMLRQFILSYGIWAPLTVLFLTAVQSVFPVVPGIMITIANAWIFGWKYGAFYSWLGALIGATIDFSIARWYGRPVAERFVGAGYLDRADLFCQKHGILAVFITRLTPIIPFKVISYGAGLTAMGYGRFALATAVGQAPAIVLYSFLGLHAARGVKEAMLAAAFFLLMALLLYYYRSRIENYFCRSERYDGEKTSACQSTDHKPE